MNGSCSISRLITRDGSGRSSGSYGQGSMVLVGKMERTASEFSPIYLSFGHNVSCSSMNKQAVFQFFSCSGSNMLPLLPGLWVDKVQDANDRHGFLCTFLSVIKGPLQSQLQGVSEISQCSRHLSRSLHR